MKNVVSARPCFYAVILGGLALLSPADATENVPHAPFAQWAELPLQGQFVVGLSYTESEAYHMWAGNTQHDVTWHSGGERYGIDITQGYVSLQYGITKKWAADVAVGYTTVGWRYFSNFSTEGTPQSTSGLMDTSFGVRYQVCREDKAASPWRPTLALRVGAVLPGTYEQGFPFSPGVRSAAVEPEVLVRKHFGWTGLGAYGDALFRWNRTTANDQYIVAVGLFQQIKNWELQVGYRRLGSISGEDILFDPDSREIYYPVGIRENSDSIEAGFNYTTTNKRWQFGFYSRTVFDGGNSDNKFWFGGYMNVALGGKKAEDLPKPVQ